MVHPDLPGQRIHVRPGGVGVLQASGWRVDESEGEWAGPPTPAYVHRLLDAFLSGQPLNFGTEHPPQDVQDRLTAAVQQGQLGTVEVPAEPAPETRRRRRTEPSEGE